MNLKYFLLGAFMNTVHLTASPCSTWTCTWCKVQILNLVNYQLSRSFPPPPSPSPSLHTLTKFTGGTYEIGTGLINLAMWHRGQEMKLKEMNQYVGICAWLGNHDFLLSKLAIRPMFTESLIICLQCNCLLLIAAV